MSDVESARVGDLLVVTVEGDSPESSGHDFREGEVVRVVRVNCNADEKIHNFEAQHLDGSDYWWLDPYEVRLATPGDIMALGVA